MCHVLVIEDHAVIARELANIVMEAGATSVEIATSPAEALERAVSRPPDVLFSDVQIIDGTGPEAVKAIRYALGPIPVIFLTADLEAGNAFRAEATLVKPVVKRDVVEAFRHATGIS